MKPMTSAPRQTGPIHPAFHRSEGFRHGFTLVEILIGSAILGMMMIILTSALRVGADSWETGEARLIRASRLFVVQSFLKRHIATLFPLNSANAQGGMDPAVQGTSQEISYIAALPDQLEGGGLYRFSIYPAGEEDNRLIRVSITPFSSIAQNDRAAPAPIDDVILLEHCEYLKFSYFGVPQNTGNQQVLNGQVQPMWMDEWREYQLPLLIKIEMSRTGEAPWPTLFIAPKTQTLR